MDDLALIRGPALADEPGLGALTLPGYLREVTRDYAEREALVFRDRASIVRWSYAELWERAVEVARALLALGCGKDSRVGVLMTNRPEWLAGVFGTAIAGGVAVPLSTFSTEPELDYLLRSAAVSILLAEDRVASKSFAQMLGRLEPALLVDGSPRSPRYPHLRHLALIGDVPTDSAFESWDDFRGRGAAIAPELAEATAAEVKPSDVGAILFSSGSTASPKGIVNSQRGIAIHLWRWRRMFALEGEVRSWTPNGFFWSGNFGTVLGATLSAGGSLVLQSVFDPVEALDLMSAERVNYPTAWPHQWNQVVAAPNWDSADLSAVRFLDPSQPLATHPTIRLSGWREPLFSYGSTETFTITTGYPTDAPREIAEGSHGFALCGNTVKIVDPDSGATLKRGEHGEIAVKGPTLMMSYLGLPPEQSFDADGFYRSGDAGWIDEADRLHFAGRLSTVIKTGGANVSPNEVDAVLETMPGVRMARCVGVPDEALGELVVACIVPAEGVTLSADAVRAFARERLASYKNPRRVLFLAGDEVALTGSAKVKPAELRKLAIERLALLDAAVA
jgi:acyl-CoA synthetase (AMP-forming)/AMP-acid ligase II